MQIYVFFIICGLLGISKITKCTGLNSITAGVGLNNNSTLIEPFDWWQEAGSAL